MKALKNLLFNKIRPNFTEGGKFEKFYPAYDAIETFLFVPGHATHKGAHIRDGIDMKRTMIMVVLALVPCLLFGIWNTGYQHFLALGQDSTLMENMMFGAWKVLAIVVVSYAVGLGVEFAFAVIKKHSVEEGFLVSGMLIPLCLPVDVPLWMVAVATIFAVIIGKEVFGGTGMNILNPALTARAFLFFAYPTKMSGDKVWVALDEGDKVVDGFSGATPLGDWATTIGMNDAMEKAEAAGKSDLAASIKTEIATTLDAVPDVAQAVMGTIPGSIGETSVIACLIGAALLLITGIGSWRIMLSMLIGGLAMGWIFNAFAVNPFMEIPSHEMICYGGFFFGMVFMATDPVSAAQTNVGKLVYGFFCGFFGIMIRVFNPAYPEGIMMSILFMNVMAPLVDHYVVEANIKRRNKRALAAA